jgi:transposase
MTLEARNAELEAANAALRAQVGELPHWRAQVTALLARVQELEARAAKDSHTSGKPPASDGLKRRTKSLRRRSGKKPGGQLGHRGETLHLVAQWATPDTVVEHRSAVCTVCQATRDGASVVRRERRQVHEVPAVRLRVREHQALHVRCPACQAVNVGTFPPRRRAAPRGPVRAAAAGAGRGR